jgi:hypothetical protein
MSLRRKWRAAHLTGAPRPNQMAWCQVAFLDDQLGSKGARFLSTP